MDVEIGEGRTLQPDGLEEMQRVAAFHPEVYSRYPDDIIHWIRSIAAYARPDIPESICVCD